ncbi:MAG: RluA family pseudouridine synthase [Bacteroidales bacterium]|nr:RluA family pseudouridine synthase [Bacteroidales bacterium]
MNLLKPPATILYEDNHLMVVNKRVSQIVQGDKTGDASLDRLLKDFIRERDHKPGEVFLGIPHRLDRPVSGAVVFAKTSKALSRMAALFKEKKVEKIYHAIVEKCPKPDSGILDHYLTRNTRQNKSYVHDSQVEGSKHARLHYRRLASSDRYHLLEVVLETGRHHQIRAQLAGIGSVIKGDRKYGAKRSNPNGGISLHARRISFIHPVKMEQIEVVAPYPRMDIFPVFFKPGSKA